MREASTCHAVSLRPENNIFITSLTPTDTHSWLALCSDDAVTLFTPDQITWTLRASHATTRAVLFKSPAQILTAGDDARIRIWDPRTSLTAPSQTFTCQAPILSLASHLDSSIIAAGTELTNREAVLSFFDVRFSSGPLQQYVEVHSDDIVSLNYHPSKSWYLVSGSADGLINAYDTRITEEDDALARVWNLDSGVSRTGFMDAGEKVWGLSCDEKLALWRLDEGDEQQGEWVFGDLRPVLGCDYVVDLLDTNAGVVVGAGYFGQSRLDLVPLRQTPAWDFLQGDAIRLGAGLGEEVVRCVVVDDANERILTGSEDHIVRIWTGFV